MDKSEILEVLSEWNYWDRDLPKTVARKGYEAAVLKRSAADEAVVLKGVRRSGKSTILLNTIKNLLAKGVARNNMLFVNLEDPRFINSLNLGLLSRIKEVYLQYLNPSGVPYIFLDEVQNIPDFEKWVVKEYELKQSRLFLTGSNARLLGREIGTALSGRYLDVTVFPLGFKEFLAFKGVHIKNRLDLVHHRIAVNRFFDEYLAFGGFPKVATIKEPDMKKAELKAYFDSIMLRDIAARYNLDNIDVLMALSVFFLSSVSNIMSVNAVKKHYKLSFDLIDRYIEYLENAYLIFRVPLFDWSVRRQQVNPRKIYAIDTGLMNIASFKTGQRIGIMMENMVFLELLRRGEEVFYYKTTGDLEVDFVVKEGEKISRLIQVTANMEDKKTKAREIRALIKAGSEIPYAEDAELVILTPDVEEKLSVEGREVQIVDVKKWLLGIGEP